MAFKAPTKVFQDYIELPCPLKDGSVKKYRVNSVSAQVGLFVQEMFALGVAAQNGIEITAADRDRLKLDDTQEEEFRQALLGDVYEEMLADGVSWEAMKTVIGTVMTWTAQTREDAEAFWEASMVSHPKVPMDRKKKQKASAKSTKKRGSPAGTMKATAETAMTVETVEEDSTGGQSSKTGS